jgi:hypothetical protein
MRRSPEICNGLDGFVSDFKRGSSDFVKHGPRQPNLSHMLDMTSLAFGPPVCLWTGTCRTFAVYCSSSVIERLRLECSMAFEKVPRRGLEIGGILIGRTETEENTTTFWVDGFLAVDSEHRWGPSYLLSESDLAHLQHQLDMCGRGCVGIYRSQTRARRLALDEADVKLCGQCFQASPALFLMLAPALKRAAFFSRADGELQSIGEFALPMGKTLPDGSNRQHQRSHIALQKRELPSRAVPHDPPTQLDGLRDRKAREIQKQPSCVATIPASPAGDPTKWRGRYAAALIAILFLLVGAGGLIRFFATRAGRDLSAPKFVDLKIQPVGSTLRLLWDPGSIPLRGATRVVLHVRDGDYQSDRDLAMSEIRSGSTAYEPRSEDVFFRLDVYSGAPAATGSVRVINAPHSVEIEARKAPSRNRPETDVLAGPAPVSASPPRLVSRVQQIPRTGDVSERWLGMSLRPVTRDVALASHLPQTYGFLITRVDAWGFAGTSGLESGDILVALNGQRIADTPELKLKIREMTRATTATVAIFRDGEIHQIEVHIGRVGSAGQSAAVGVRQRGTTVVAPPSPR